jgi:hypothetical protein
MTYSSHSEKATEKRPNTGVLFRNTNKEKDQHSDFSGELDVNGEKFWLNGWTRVSKSGVKFLSLSVKSKGEKKAVPFNDDIGL